jgi:hypothetical protein
MALPMTEPIRDELIQKLSELSMLAPEYRFGQMICNLAHLAKDSPSAVWDLEDAELLAALNQHLASWRKIRGAALAKIR